MEARRAQPVTGARPRPSGRSTPPAAPSQTYVVHAPAPLQAVKTTPWPVVGRQGIGRRTPGQRVPGLPEIPEGTDSGTDARAIATPAQPPISPAAVRRFERSARLLKVPLGTVSEAKAAFAAENFRALCRGGARPGAVVSMSGRTGHQILASGPSKRNALVLSPRSGGGSYGAFHRAVCVDDGGERAVKTLCWMPEKGLTASPVTEILSEFKLWRRFDPDVRLVVDPLGRAYLITTELAEANLKQTCQAIDASRFDPITALKAKLFCVQQSFSAVAAAHALGVAHRDVKPENMLVTANGQVFFLCDLGTSCDDADMHATMVGTPIYMAPELYLDADYDPKAVDIWALGVLALEVLTGETVVPRVMDRRRHRQFLAAALRGQLRDRLAPKIDSLLAKIREQQRMAAALIPESLFTFIESALQSDPTARPLATALPQLVPDTPESGQFMRLLKLDRDKARDVARLRKLREQAVAFIAQ